MAVILRSMRSTVISFSASVMLLVTQTACSAGPPEAVPPPSTVAWTTPVSPPATPSSGGVPCVDLDRAGREGASGGGVRAGAFREHLGRQRGGAAKRWVAQG